VCTNDHKTTHEGLFSICAECHLVIPPGILDSVVIDSKLRLLLIHTVSSNNIVVAFCCLLVVFVVDTDCQNRNFTGTDRTRRRPAQGNASQQRAKLSLLRLVPITFLSYHFSLLLFVTCFTVVFVVDNDCHKRNLIGTDRN
jgi:Na+/melibiose symporter-like transporter